MIIIDVETIPDNIADVIKAESLFSGVGDLKNAWDNIAKLSAIEEEKTEDEAEKPKRKGRPKKEVNQHEAAMKLFKGLSSANGYLVKQASLDPMFSRIISIGTITATSDGSSERVFFSEKSEKDLLISFWEFIEQERIPCQTITFNGIGFDLPMLYIRSMVHGVSIPWRDKKIRKYSEYPHFDVMQMLCFWGIHKFRSLDWWAKILGYDCEPGVGPNGSWVSKWFALGEYDKIKEYNMGDCRKTLFVYRRMKDYFPSLPTAKTSRKANVGSSYD